MSELDEYNDDFPAEFMNGTAAAMLDFVLMGGDLCKALGIERIEDAAEED